MPDSRDEEIRSALHRKKLKRMHACPNTLVYDELGLAHARVRIDVAVINGSVHGFEIKSALDTLDRLPKQLTIYGQCLEKLTVVCDVKHTRDVRKLAPRWCGIVEASKGTRGGIDFCTIRKAQRNPDVRAEKLAHLLWRHEVVMLLEQLDASPKILRQPRAQLYRHLAKLLTVEEITCSIREFMANRQGWRGLPAHA